MRCFVLLSLLLLISIAYSASIPYPNAAYADLNAKAKASIRKLADILDMEMLSRRLPSSSDNAYYHVYPQRMSSLPLTIYPLPAKRLHRIGGNIVMGK
uniref:Neuropeptide F n=1 Tax=Caenorhabditis tropicalis TaxID=1561998 RepID=A0A1I7U4G2_9PELO